MNIKAYIKTKSASQLEPLEQYWHDLPYTVPLSNGHSVTITASNEGCKVAFYLYNNALTGIIVAQIGFAQFTFTYTESSGGSNTFTAPYGAHYPHAEGRYGYTNNWYPTTTLQTPNYFDSQHDALDDFYGNYGG